MNSKRLVFIQKNYTKEAVINIVSDVLKQLKIKHKVGHTAIEMEVSK
jgi:hypothetical protein